MTNEKLEAWKRKFEAMSPEDQQRVIEAQREWARKQVARATDKLREHERAMGVKQY